MGATVNSFRVLWTLSGETGTTSATLAGIPPTLRLGATPEFTSEQDGKLTGPQEVECEEHEPYEGSNHSGGNADDFLGGKGVYLQGYP